MASFREQISQAQNLMKKIQEDREFIEREKAYYEERVAEPSQRIKSNKYQYEEIATTDVFVCLKDVACEVARKWECPPQFLDIQFIGDRHYDGNINDATMRNLAPYYSASSFLLQIRDNKHLFWIKVSVNRNDIQLDGKSFEEHIIAKPHGNGKVCSVDDYTNLVFRVGLDKVVKVSGDNVVYQGEVGEILSKAILRREEREIKSQTANDEDENEAE